MSVTRQSDNSSQSGSAVPPLNREMEQRRDASSTLGHESQSTLSPEGAKERKDLPKGWRWVTLGEVAESMKNGIYKPAASYADDGLACLRMYNIDGGRIVWRDIKRMRLSEEEIREYELLPGDLLVNRVNSRELVGKAAAISAGLERCVFESKNIRVRLRRDLASTEFVSYRLLSAGRRYFTQNAQQVVGMASISQPQVGRFPLPLPPLDEQQRIVAEIEKQFTRLEAGVTALRRVQANLKRYRAAVLKAACEGRLVPTEAQLAKVKVQSGSGVPPLNQGRQSRDGSATLSATFETGEHLLQRILTERRQNWSDRALYKEPAGPDTTTLGPLPEGWTWASVEQVADVALGKMLDKNKHQTGSKLSYLRNINVRWGTVDTDDVSEMFFEDDQLERFSLSPGDVLVCEGGEPGRAAVWDGRVPGMMYQKAIHRVRFFGTFNSRYLVFLLEFLAKTGRLERRFTGSTIKHFTRESFIALPIPLPPLAEQTRIVAEVERRLSVVEELEAVVSANLRRANRLRLSILQKAFTGELGVEANAPQLKG